MIDWTKPIQTRDGRKARYVGTVRDGSSYPVIVAISYENCSLETSNWVAENGCDDTTAQSDRDIINVPVIEERWLNIYKAGSRNSPIPHNTAAEADEMADRSAQGKVKITYHNGVAVGCEFFKAV